MEAEKLWLGGRCYVRLVNGPLRQDLFVMQHARHAGLVGVEILESEEPEDFAQRVLSMVLGSGRALLLLGGLLIPDGKKSEDWTEEMAFETAGHLGGIEDPEEKKKVQTELLSVMLGFFVNGLASWIASGRSSRGDEAPPGTSPKADGVRGTGSSDSSATSSPSDASESSAG